MQEHCIVQLQKVNMNTRECFLCKLLFPFWKLGKANHITYSKIQFLLIPWLSAWHVQNVNADKNQTLSYVPETPLLTRGQQ